VLPRVAAQEEAAAAADAGTLYIAGTFGRFTTADGVVHNVTGIAEWDADTIKGVGMGVTLPQEAISVDYHPNPPQCVRTCKNSKT